MMSKILNIKQISLYKVAESDTHIFLFMELYVFWEVGNLTSFRVLGGELFDEISKRGTFSEVDAAKIIRQIASAIKYIHERNIVHRDLKPENLLFASPNAHIIKLADFGKLFYSLIQRLIHSLVLQR